MKYIAAIFIVPFLVIYDIIVFIPTMHLIMHNVENKSTENFPQSWNFLKKVFEI